MEGQRKQEVSILLIYTSLFRCRTNICVRECVCVCLSLSYEKGLNWILFCVYWQSKCAFFWVTWLQQTKQHHYSLVNAELSAQANTHCCTPCTEAKVCSSLIVSKVLLLQHDAEICQQSSCFQLKLSGRTASVFVTHPKKKNNRKNITLFSNKIIKFTWTQRRSVSNTDRGSLRDNRSSNQTLCYTGLGICETAKMPGWIRMTCLHRGTGSPHVNPPAPCTDPWQWQKV